MHHATEALAGFLSAVDFTAFATFTTRKPATVSSMRRIAEKLGKHIGAGESSTLFWAAEKFDAMDGMKSTAVLRHPGDWHHTDYTTSRYHFHALMRTHHSPIDLFGWFQERYGRCQIIDNTEPDRRHSAAWYCSKYCTKQLADYDIYFARDIKERAQLGLYKMLNPYQKFP